MIRRESVRHCQRWRRGRHCALLAVPTVPQNGLVVVDEDRGESPGGGFPALTPFAVTPSKAARNETRGYQIGYEP